MGFLDNTTNSIVIDAVLTERGRELLSQNDSSFTIDSFGFGDDEVDYSNIVKYGLNIGKEKIEKNTPIFEAQTNENLAIKYHNITLSNSRLRALYIPQLYLFDTDISLTPAAASPIILYSNSDNQADISKEIKVLSTLLKESGQTEIDANLRDRDFYVKLHSELLQLTINDTDTGLIGDDDENRIRTFKLISTDSSAALTGSQNFALANRQLLKFTIKIVSNLSNTEYEKFGTLTSTTVNNVTTLTGSINTYVEVIGGSSGTRLLIPIQIKLS